MSKKMKKIY